MLRESDAYLQARVKRGEIGALTKANYQRAFTSFAKSYGDKPLERMTSRDVEKWLEDNPQWKPGTRRHHWGCMRDFCHHLVSRGILQTNPFIGLDKPRGSRPAPAPLAAPDVEKLFINLPDARARLIVELMYTLGLRCASVSALQVTDIDWVNGEIHVVGKGNRHYSVPLVDSVANAIRAYLSEYPASAGPLIRSYVRSWAPIKPNTIGDMVAAWMRDAGVKTHPGDRRSAHTLRATALTEVARASEDPYVVQALAGHASIATAAWYVPRVGTKAVAAALDKRAMERAVMRPEA